MKKLLSVFGILSLIFVACNEKSIDNMGDFNGNSISVDNENIVYFNYDFPIGTVLEEINNTIYYTVPPDFEIIGAKDGGYTGGTNKGSVNCNCDGGEGGCSPATVGGSYACVMTSCSSCKKKNSTRKPNNDLNDYDDFNYDDVQEVAIFEKNKMVFFNNASELNGRRFLPAVFYDHPKIVEKLLELEQNLLSSENPNVKKMVFVDIFGYVIPIEIPADIDNTSPFAIADGTNSSGNSGSGSISCTCNSKGSCPKKSKLIATWCEATDCSDCTLSGSVFNPGDPNPKDLSVVHNRIVISE